MAAGLNLKILTYNIHKGFSSSNLRFVLHQIKSAIATVHPDLVFLQEIQGEHIKRGAKIHNWPTQTQFEFLADQLWPHYAYGKNAIYKSGHHGNAILSKFPFISWENIDVSIHKSASRSLLHGILAIPSLLQPIHVICIHLGLFKAERTQQLRTLCERISSHVPQHEPLIIAGDFNDWQNHAEQHLINDLGLQEIFKTLKGQPAKTFPVWSPTLAVDRIYYRGFTATACECFNQMPWRRLSDHAALYAEFVL
jgi:endonuclease/exonuclease/phosphatase family metal-dependent hydrolase